MAVAFRQPEKRAFAFRLTFFLIGFFQNAEAKSNLFKPSALPIKFRELVFSTVILFNWREFWQKHKCPPFHSTAPEKVRWKNVYWSQQMSSKSLNWFYVMNPGHSFGSFTMVCCFSCKISSTFQKHAASYVLFRPHEDAQWHIQHSIIVSLIFGSLLAQQLLYRSGTTMCFCKTASEFFPPFKSKKLESQHVY